jgi:hypothetical protein
MQCGQNSRFDLVALQRRLCQRRDDAVYTDCGRESGNQKKIGCPTGTEGAKPSFQAIFVVHASRLYFVLALADLGIPK